MFSCFSHTETVLSFVVRRTENRDGIMFIIL